jgi:hypothetical protein
MQDLVTLARAPSHSLVPSDREPGDGAVCACCAAARAVHFVGDTPLCLTCLPAWALDAPGIDEIACLIWLPHLDQGVLSRITAALHAAAAHEGHTIHDRKLTGRPAAARLAYDALKELEGEVVQRLGSSRLSDLRQAVLRLSDSQIANRQGESGLRVLFSGRWFAPQPDRYFLSSRPSRRNG